MIGQSGAWCFLADAGVAGEQKRGMLRRDMAESLGRGKASRTDLEYFEKAAGQFCLTSWERAIIGRTSAWCVRISSPSGSESITKTR